MPPELRAAARLPDNREGYFQMLRYHPTLFRCLGTQVAWAVIPYTFFSTLSEAQLITILDANILASHVLPIILPISECGGQKPHLEID